MQDQFNVYCVDSNSIVEWCVVIVCAQNVHQYGSSFA